MKKELSYDLNKKHFYFLISMDLLLLITFLFINYSIIFSRNGNDTALNIFIILGLPFFVVFTGIGAALIYLYYDIRILLYKQKSVLVVTEEEITYYSFLNKKSVVKKDNIEKIYTTMTNGKHLAFVTKKPIEGIVKKATILRSAKFSSLSHCLYINVREINIDPEILAKQIEETLSIPIKKKKNNLYF